jgi:hypothetical protein
MAADCLDPRAGAGGKSTIARLPQWQRGLEQMEQTNIHFENILNKGVKKLQ